MNSGSTVFGPDDYIQEGASPAAGTIVLACTVGEDYDNPKNRILVRRSEAWLEFGSSGEAVLSIDASADGMAYVLGENGTVIRFDWRAPTRDELRASRSLFANEAVVNIGALRRIRILGGDVLCGGSGGQVYQLMRSRFERLPILRIGSNELTIEDLSGSSARDFIAVTSDGVGMSFNGVSWDDLDLPTNAGLSSVCRVGDGRYAIAGRSGTIIVGNDHQWTSVKPIADRHYWGVGARGGRIYAAYLGGIDVYDGGEITPLATPHDTELEYTVLREGPDGIWSFAGGTIGLITDDGWRTVVSR
jgi:hypothetical protein